MTSNSVKVENLADKKASEKNNTDPKTESNRKLKKLINRNDPNFVRHILQNSIRNENQSPNARKRTNSAKKFNMEEASKENDFPENIIIPETQELSNENLLQKIDILMREVEMLKTINEKLRRKVHGPHRNKEAKKESNFESENIYNALLEEEDDSQSMAIDTGEEEETREDRRSISERPVNSQTQSQQEIAANSTDQQSHQPDGPIRKSKPPPIIIMGNSPQLTIQLLENNITFKKLDDFYTSRNNSTKHTIYTGCAEDYDAVVRSLKARNVQFFTYTPKDRKLQTVSLKSLEGDFELEGILSELNNKKVGNLKFLKIRKFETTRSKTNSEDLAIYSVQLSADSWLKDIHQIKGIGHQSVQWDRLIKKEALQCMKCQRLGHAAANCNLGYRCVKCSNQHAPGECELKKPDKENSVDATPPYCINSKSHGHSASYRGCPTLRKIRDAFIKKRMELSNNRSMSLANLNRKIDPKISFSQVIRNSQNVEHLAHHQHHQQNQQQHQQQQHQQQQHQQQQHRQHQQKQQPQQQRQHQQQQEQNVAPNMIDRGIPPQWRNLFDEFANRINASLNALVNKVEENSKRIDSLFQIHEELDNSFITDSQVQ